MSTVRFGPHKVRLPANRLLRMGLGILLILGGFLWFLPIVGLWMMPLGLIVLSVDVPAVRRWRRRFAVRLGAWLKPRYPKIAEAFGYRNGNQTEKP